MLSVIIPHYQGKRLLQQCLHSLFENWVSRSPASAPPIPSERSDAWLPLFNSLELIIVDNNSADGSRKFLNKLNSNFQTSSRHPDFSTKSKSSGSSVDGVPGMVIRHPLKMLKKFQHDNGDGNKQHDILSHYPESPPRHPESPPRHPELVSGSSEGGKLTTMVVHPAEDAEPSATMSEDQHDNNVAIPDNIEIKTILNKTNLGFAKAVNQGARLARGDYILVLNDDVRLAPDWLAEMEKTIKSRKGKKVAAYGGVILNGSGKRLESLGLRYNMAGRAENTGNGELWVKAQKKYQRWLAAPHFILGPNGAAAVYRRDIFLKLGGFDESLFAYLEDVDFALRLWNSRWQAVFVPGAKAFHFGGATSGKMGNLRQRMAVRNWWWLLIKNYPLRIFWKHGPEILLERMRNAAYLIKNTKKGEWPATLKWCGQNLLKLPAIWKQRKPLPRLAKVKRGTLS